MADQKMIKILNMQEELFSIENQHLSKDELTRKAQDLVLKYESYLSDNPSDVTALLLFGKFLRKVGQDDHALGIFLEADSVNPKLAVVKQQIANFLVEKGRPMDALPFFVEATKISPLSHEYHFHLGNFLFIFREQILLNKILEKKSLQKLTHQCFEKAASLQSTSFQYRLRFAQSFFDYEESNNTEAIKVWLNIIDDFEGLSKSELDYLNLCIARLQIGLGNKSDAKRLIEQISTQSLGHAKEELIFLLKKDLDSKIENKIEKKKTGLKMNLKIDSRLQNLQKITGQLREENLIKDLEVDRIEAYHNDNGDLKLSIIDNDG